MGNCRDCKFWGENGMCDKQHDKVALIWVSMYDSIHTAPDFGCVLFEAKA